jgi:hypothetical protein
MELEVCPTKTCFTLVIIATVIGQHTSTNNNSFGYYSAGLSCSFKYVHDARQNIAVEFPPERGK